MAFANISSGSLLKKRFSKDDLEAGREYVEAYVTLFTMLSDSIRQPRVQHRALS